MAPKPVSPTLMASPFWIAAPSFAFSEKESMPILLNVTSPSALMSRAITFACNCEINNNDVINKENAFDMLMLSF